ncbi:MAG: biopolymer transporter ExbD [Verrucomicrobia bacterium]|nr:biopolymer transporter ExbD [Verrucomicrobiota bacterium]
MKFPRSNKPLAGQLDAAPFAGVFLLLLIFVALSRNLVFTPGLPIRLPEAVDLAGTPNATVAVAVDAGGQIYFDSQVVSEDTLRQKLGAEVGRSRAPLTLVVLADKEVKNEILVRLGLLARDVGIKDALLATRPKLSARDPLAP